MSVIALPEFADKLSAIMPVIMREFSKKIGSELYQGKITLPQFIILEFLHREGESKMTDLARFMSVTTAAMTGFVERLVRDGYVERVFDPGDRRVIIIKLTGKGAVLVKKVNAQRRSTVINIFGQISQAEREEYLKILTRIHNILLNKAGS